MDPAIYARQFGFCDYVLKANLAGVDQETSLVAPERGGNNLNWVLGHILATRNGIFKLFGIEPFWSDEQSAPYGRGSEPVTADRAMPLEELLAEFDRSQANLMGPGLGADTGTTGGASRRAKPHPGRYPGHGDDGLLLPRGLPRGPVRNLATGGGTSGSDPLIGTRNSNRHSTSNSTASDNQPLSQACFRLGPSR